MATVVKQVSIAVAPERVWDAVRDWGAVHRRLCPGVLTDARVEGEARIVTFANGQSAKEMIVAVDDSARRLVWAVVETRMLSHHNGAMQVLAEGEGSRLVWTADFLPDTAAPQVAGLMELGCAAAKAALEG